MFELRDQFDALASAEHLPGANRTRRSTSTCAAALESTRQRWRRAGGFGQRHDRQQSRAHVVYRGAGSGEQPRPALCAGGRQASITAGTHCRELARLRPLAGATIAVTPPATKSKHCFILIVILFSSSMLVTGGVIVRQVDQLTEVNMVLNAFDLTGKVAIVTGCDTGLDRE